MPANLDYNLDRGRRGIARFQATVDSGGTRSSTSAAYLPATVTNRSNLSILTATRVTRLNIENGSVNAVELAQSRDGPRYYVKARKEVVVCMGSYGTPQLLLVSGIGPSAEVEKLGVHSQVDLPGVGKNLKDHLMAGPTFNTKPGTSGQYLRHPVKGVSLDHEVNEMHNTDVADPQSPSVALEWNRSTLKQCKNTPCELI